MYKFYSSFDEYFGMRIGLSLEVKPSLFLPGVSSWAVLIVIYQRAGVGSWIYLEASRPCCYPEIIISKRHSNGTPRLWTFPHINIIGSRDTRQLLIIVNQSSSRRLKVYTVEKKHSLASSRWGRPLGFPGNTQFNVNSVIKHPRELLPPGRLAKDANKQR